MEDGSEEEEGDEEEEGVVGCQQLLRRDWMVIEEIQVGMSWLNTWMNWRRISVAVAERVHRTSCDTTQDGGSTPLHPPHPDIHTHMMMMPFICSCRNNK